jgi:hypothetical protein
MTIKVSGWLVLVDERQTRTYFFVGCTYDLAVLVTF